MRIAVVTDVHGNLSALEAVIADLRQVAPDIVVQGGDLVAMGHRPAHVLDRVRELGWPGVQGNTDEMLWRPELFDRFMTAAPHLAHIWTMVFQQQGPATREHLGAERIEWLHQMPLEWRDDDLAVVHATPGNLWRSPIADATDEDLAATYAPWIAASPRTDTSMFHSSAASAASTASSSSPIAAASACPSMAIRARRTSSSTTACRPSATSNTTSTAKCRACCGPATRTPSAWRRRCAPDDS